MFWHMMFACYFNSNYVQLQPTTLLMKKYANSLPLRARLRRQLHPHHSLAALDPIALVPCNELCGILAIFNN